MLLGISVTAWPPAVSPDGGWRSAEADGTTIHEFAAGTPYALVGIPEFKTLNAVRFPLERLGADPPGPEALAGPDAPGLVAIVCDPLFEAVIGAACGGPAERAWLAAVAWTFRRLATAPGGPRRVISFYGPVNARTPAPADRRSLSPRPERGGTFRSCPGVFYGRPGVRVGGRAEGRGAP